ncbi:hypothetical protein C8J57DRAFT_1526772 [Mycena rebaudengoi]|nr:hypothetical protein C8J57DRAFT_1526772 [Mycena rebaudengoi]
MPIPIALTGCCAWRRALPPALALCALVALAAEGEGGIAPGGEGDRSRMAMPTVALLAEMSMWPYELWRGRPRPRKEPRIVQAVSLHQKLSNAAPARAMRVLATQALPLLSQLVGAHHDHLGDQYIRSGGPI